jgi:hypothetical protein
MTVNRDDIVAAISKLNDLTRRKELTWYSVDPETRGQMQGRGILKASYATQYDDRRLRLNEFSVTRPRWSNDDSPQDTSCALEILDDYGDPIYEFPEVQGISDLLASVKGQLANVEGLISPHSPDEAVILSAPSWIMV